MIYCNIVRLVGIVLWIVNARNEYHKKDDSVNICGND